MIRAAVMALAAIALGTQTPPAVAPPRAISSSERLDNSQRAFVDGVRGQLIRDEFGYLDRLAEDLLRSRARFPGGDWKLYRFYGALGRPSGGYTDLSDRAADLSGSGNAQFAPTDGDVHSDQTWERHIAHLRKWRADRPASSAAAIALGDALISYAWKARGGAFAIADREPFLDRLAEADAILRDGHRLSSNNPHFYFVMMDVARGQGWTRSKVDTLLEDAVLLEPLYLHAYSTEARYLLPRWYGKDGDWERFAETMADRIGGREGSVIYGHIAWQMSGIYGAKAFFVQNNVSWPRIKQSFVDREALYGTNVQTMNAFCLLAAGGGDKATARALFARIGEMWDSDVWKEHRYFESYRTWALKE